MKSTMRTRLAAAAALLLLGGCGGGGGGNNTPPSLPPAGNYTDPVAYSSAASASLPSAAEITAVTRHQLALGAATLDYTATVGHLTALGLTSGTPQASFFYVAYTLDGAAPATRPVTFFYNGGPGAASVWLHLGSFGPKRIDTGEPNMSGVPPFPLVDNAETLLDVTDLVFVDAVGAGYSQAVAPHVNRAFWGVDVDAAVFRDFVMRYTTVNNRGASPKFLYGESYGGPRTAIMADLLESAGVRLAGVVLQSPAMDYYSNCGVRPTATSCSGYLPSYGATASWFGFATPSASPAQLPAFMDEMRVLAAGEYETAVQAYLAQNTRPAASLLDRLVATTGLARVQWEAGVNRSPEFYRTNLRAGTVYGRYDTRVTLPNNAVPGQEPDPSSALISPSFGLRVTEYLASLGYTTPSNYVMLGNAIQAWNFSHDGGDLPDTIPDLAAALTQNPDLKVLAVNGYHDIATPFFTTETDLARLGAHPNVRVRNYLGGHMTYLENASRRAMKADLADFYRSALGN